MHKHLSYDGHGINDTDEYRSRIATFASGMYDDEREKFGHLFAAAPDLLAALVDLVARCDNHERADGSSPDTLAAHVAIARAAGKDWPPTDEEEEEEDIGGQSCCVTCGMDVEYHGADIGWIGRGGDAYCDESGAAKYDLDGCPAPIPHKRHAPAAS